MQQKILDTVAMLNRRGLPVNREALARWMGIHPNGGRFLTSLARLRDGGYLSGFDLTAEGEGAAGGMDTGPDALLEAIRATKKEGGARADMMEQILEKGPFPSRLEARCTPRHPPQRRPLSHQHRAPARDGRHPGEGRDPRR